MSNYTSLTSWVLIKHTIGIYMWYNYYTLLSCVLRCYKCGRQCRRLFKGDDKDEILVVIAGSPCVDALLLSWLTGNASFHCVMFSWICSLWFVSRMSSQGLFTIWIGKGPVWTHCDVPADLCQINQTISSAHLDTRECNCLSHRAHHFSACWPEAYLSYNYLIVQLMFCFQMKPKQMLPQQLRWLWRHLCYGESISALWSASGADTSLLHFHLEGFYQAHTHKHIMIHVTMMTGDYSDSDS